MRKVVKNQKNIFFIFFTYKFLLPYLVEVLHHTTKASFVTLEVGHCKTKTVVFFQLGQGGTKLHILRRRAVPPTSFFDTCRIFSHCRSRHFVVHLPITKHFVGEILFYRSLYA